MKPLAKFFLLIVALIAQEHSFAQQRVLAMSVATTPPPGDTTEFGVPIIDSTTLFVASMNVVLSGTDSIFQVHVKLGTTLHGSQLLSTSFNYGVDGTFGTTSYSQTGNVISLGLGTQAGMIYYFAEVQIEKTDHTYEDAVLFSNN